MHTLWMLSNLEVRPANPAAIFEHVTTHTMKPMLKKTE